MALPNQGNFPLVPNIMTRIVVKSWNISNFFLLGHVANCLIFMNQTGELKKYFLKVSKKAVLCRLIAFSWPLSFYHWLESIISCVRQFDSITDTSIEELVKISKHKTKNYGSGTAKTLKKCMIFDFKAISWK